MLLFVFLFNVGGYYVVYLGLRYHANNRMTARLDNENYSADETITIKIPFNLPYQEDQSTYKRVEGDFQHNGEFYKKVKQKIENGTLYLVCIKNRQEKNAFAFMTDMVKASTDTQGSPATKLLNSLIKDYVSASLIKTISSQQSWSFDNDFIEDQPFNVLTRISPVDNPPPEFLS